MSTLHRTFVLRNITDMQALSGFLSMNARAMADAGKPLAVQINEHKAKRTSEQNKRLHALLTEISTYAWVDGKQYDEETWKEWARQKFIGTEEIELPGGKRFERGISTTTLSVSEFSDFLTQVEMFAQTELGIDIA